MPVEGSQLPHECGVDPVGAVREHKLFPRFRVDSDKALRRPHFFLTGLLQDLDTVGPQVYGSSSPPFLRLEFIFGLSEILLALCLHDSLVAR